MTDTVLANANKRRDLIASEINSLAQRMDELKRDLAQIDAWIAQWHEFAIVATGTGDSALMAVTVGADTGGDAEPKRRRTAGNPTKEIVVEKAKELIHHKGHPVSRNALFADLEQAGITLKGTDPKMVLSTMLWRMSEEIVRLPGFGYWLKSEPYGPAGYVPGGPIEVDEEEINMENAAQDGDLPLVDQEMEREAVEAHRRARWGDPS